MGGTCGSYPKSPTLDDLAGVGLQSRWESPQGCCPDIGGAQSGSGYDRCVNSRGFTWPKNGEFEWGGVGSSCYMCSDVSKGYGCSNPCGSKGGTVGGKRPTVRRIAYKADPTFCCTTGRSTDGTTTCDPKYRDGVRSSACHSVLQNYCGQTGSDGRLNLFSQPVCKEWSARPDNLVAMQTMAKAFCVGAKARGSDCVEFGRDPSNVLPWREVLYRECGGESQIGTPFCQEQLVKYGAGLVDSAATAYCQQFPESSFCTCVNPPDSSIKDPVLRNILSNPQCFSQRCVAGGYKTTGQAAFTCPTEFNVCSNSTSASSGGSNSQTAQDCVINTYRNIYGSGESAGAGAGAGAGASGSSSDPSSTNFFSSLTTAKKIILVVAILLILLGGGGMFWILTAATTSESGGPKATLSADAIA
jgi:hypothetical protein